jgi:two-component system chemotaxis sensor kinase CheA
LEEIDARKIELSNGRHMVQYRGQLMPLITMSTSVSVKGEGAQPLLVFSDGARSMALVVDEIIDIVEDQLDIQVAGDNPGVLGSAVIKGQATEIVDVGHFLPLAFEDWFRRKDQASGKRSHSVLLIDDSPFFRNMLTPVLQAAGYAVTTTGSAREALAMLRDGRTFDVAVTDIEMPDIDGFGFAEAVRADPRTADLPVIGLSSQVSADAIERGRQAGFHDFVAKFDRQGLIAALMEQTNVGHAA